MTERGFNRPSPRLLEYLSNKREGGVSPLPTVSVGEASPEDSPNLRALLTRLSEAFPLFQGEEAQKILNKK